MDKSKTAIEIFDKFAVQYQNKFMDLDLYHDTFDFFCKNIPKQNAEILEIACGPGNITRYLLNQRPDFKILGTDLAPNMLELAKTNNPTAEFQLMDGRAIGKLNKKYDAIMCGFCFPYFTKEETIQFIADASNLLNENGILYLSTMENDYSKSGLKKGSAGDEIFIHYHQQDYLTTALKENNFKIVNVQRKNYKEDDGSITIDLIIIAGK